MRNGEKGSSDSGPGNEVLPPVVGNEVRLENLGSGAVWSIVSSCRTHLECSWRDWWKLHGLSGSDGIFGLVAHVRSAGDQVAPIVQILKAMNKNLQDSSRQLSGSGKMQNMNLKDHVAGQGKILSDQTELLKRLVEGVGHLEESTESMCDNQKTSNGLLEKLLEAMKNEGKESTIPASGAVPPFSGPPKIPDAEVLRPPAPPSTPLTPGGGYGTGAIPGSGTGMGLEVVCRDQDLLQIVPPGFKRLKLEDGGHVILPMSWLPQPQIDLVALRARGESLSELDNGRVSFQLFEQLFTRTTIKGRLTVMFC